VIARAGDRITTVQGTLDMQVQDRKTHVTLLVHLYMVSSSLVSVAEHSDRRNWIDAPSRLVCEGKQYYDTLECSTGATLVLLSRVIHARRGDVCEGASVVQWMRAQHRAHP